MGLGVLSVVDAPEVITEGRGVQARQRGGERDARVDSEATGLHDEVEQRRPDGILGGEGLDAFGLPRFVNRPTTLTARSSGGSPAGMPASGSFASRSGFSAALILAHSASTSSGFEAAPSAKTCG